MWDLGLDLGAEKEQSRKTEEIQIKSIISYKYYTHVNFLVLTNVAWLCKMLTLGEAGEGELSALSLQLLSK